MDWIVKLIDWLKIPARHAAAIALGCAALLFLPDVWLEKLQVDQIVDDYGSIIGVVFIVSVGLATVNILLSLAELVMNKWTRHRFINRAIARLGRLDHLETAVLREFHLRRQNTLHLPTDQPIVAGLLSLGILEVVSTQGRIHRSGTLFPVRIAAELGPRLNAEMLGLPTGQPTEADLERIARARPGFLVAIDQRGEKSRPHI